MILMKIARYELDEKSNPVKEIVGGFKPQFVLADSVEEAEYRLYAGYLENKVSPCFNLDGFFLVKLWSDGVEAFDKKAVRDVVADIIDEVNSGKPDNFQVNGKMF